MSEAYDLVAVGADSAGTAAAVRAANYGARALLIASAARGEICVKVGCVLKKSMCYGAEMAHRRADTADDGCDAHAASFDCRGLKECGDTDALTDALRRDALYQHRFDCVTLR